MEHRPWQFYLREVVHMGVNFVGFYFTAIYQNFVCWIHVICSHSNPLLSLNFLLFEFASHVPWSNHNNNHSFLAKKITQKPWNCFEFSGIKLLTNITYGQYLTLTSTKFWKEKKTEYLYFNPMKFKTTCMAQFAVKDKKWHIWGDNNFNPCQPSIEAFFSGETQKVSGLGRVHVVFFSEGRNYWILV